jgi:eukaryotic-like serine/threonine-protein kinase
MAILSGKRLGPYEILSAIGAGGMGDVYRARDTRLERIVAVKILPDSPIEPNCASASSGKHAPIASLNHPHICVLHDIGQQDGTNFLVMEYLEGETLAERLKKGPLPLDQVLQCAIEISDALDKAHRKGVTHRDLKPGNIILTKSGAKLLDFGLAKLRGPQAPVASLSALPTEGSNLTAQGTIVGTLQYMAPEQLEGKEADARTDIFAFGAVVYEMATGKKAFEGKTQASLIAAILEREPPAMSSLQPMTPPQLDRVVKTCLAKEPDERWQAASDLCREPKWIGESASTHGGSLPVAAPVRKKRCKAAIWVGAAVAACVIVGFAGWMLKPTSPKLITRFAVSLPPGQRLDLEAAVAISPDGTHLVYGAGPNNRDTQLYIRAMDGLEFRPIPGTQGGGNPFFSSDGQWIGFTTLGKLFKVSLSGGAPVNLSDIGFGAYYGASWGIQGKIAIADQAAGPIQQVPDTGGTSQPLTRLDKGRTHPTLASVFTWRPRSALHDRPWGKHHEDRRPIAGDGGASRTGPRRLFSSLRSPGVPCLSAKCKFDGRAIRSQATGDHWRSGPIIDSILPPSTNGYPQYDFSSTGSLVYVPGSDQAARFRLVWVDRKGVEKPIAAPAHVM